MLISEDFPRITPAVARLPRGPHLPGEPCNHSDSVQCSSSQVPVPRPVLGWSELDLEEREQQLYRLLDLSPWQKISSEGLPDWYHPRSYGSMDPQKRHRMGSKPRRDSAGRSISSLGEGDISDANKNEYGNRNMPETQSSYGYHNPPHSNNNQPASGPPSFAQANHDIEQSQPTPYKDIHLEEPQNGRTARLHALTGFLVVLNCWGIGNAWGIFQAYYEIAYLHNTSPSSIAWIGSTQLALVFGLGFPVGKLVDMGYFHAVFRTGSFLMVLGIFCTAWCKSLGTLWVAQGLVTGSGMGFLFCSGSE